MRNKYPGICFVCSEKVEANAGFFQSAKQLGTIVWSGLPPQFKSQKWLLRCKKCVGKGNKNVRNVVATMTYTAK